VPPPVVVNVTLPVGVPEAGEFTLRVTVCVTNSPETVGLAGVPSSTVTVTVPFSTLKPMELAVLEPEVESPVKTAEILCDPTRSVLAVLVAAVVEHGIMPLAGRA